MKFRITFFLSFILLFPLSLSLFSQQVIIKGKILDVNTHRAVPHANIYVKGTKIGTISDFAGKFNLTIPKAHSKMVLLFQHINYDIKEIAINEIKKDLQIYLQPRVIPLPGVEVEAVGEHLEIKKDLPQMISVVKAKEFELRGFVDAGDLLRTDHSVQVDEDLSGKKTISIRGGNSDDVVVLYNGIKMNSQFDNIFDFSLIDVEDIERFEVIKGSNTALYGSEAFSGVVNIVPKMQQDYTLRFQQRIGTYDSGNWGLHFYKKLGKFHSSYRIRQGGARRKFSDAVDESEFLENLATHHTANVQYRFSEGPGGIAKDALSAMYIRSLIDYNDYRSSESVSNFNEILTARYTGDIYKIRNLNLYLSRRQMDETQSLTFENNWLDRELRNKSLNLNTEKTFSFNTFDILLAYQYEQAKLKFNDDRGDFSSFESEAVTAWLNREHHGVVSILKLHAPSGSDILKTVDFDLSFRHDDVKDQLDDSEISATESTIDLGSGNRWSESTVKIATQFTGYYNTVSFDIFMNVGTNVKFPSLSQLISSRLALDRGITEIVTLEPEKNKSVELGLSIKRNLQFHPSIYGWQITGNYIKNHFDNKFRPYYIFGLPIAFYDNVPDAKISGFESKSSVFLYKKKVTLELGLSKYNIAEKAAFPFKYESKKIFNFIVDHAGYSFLLHWFIEGEQTAWVRQTNNLFNEVTLPEYTNIDLHMSKTFSLGKFKLFGNVSFRNLLNDDYSLEGLALRDRRYYVTVGLQY